MKTLFLLPAFLCAACYSAEFFPADNYPNLKRGDIGRVEIRYSRPERPFHRLGRLVLKQFNGNIRDDGFVNFLRAEARKRGAEGAWIQYRRIRSHTSFEALTRHQRQDRAGGRNPAAQPIRGRLGVVRVILYNMVRSDK